MFHSLPLHFLTCLGRGEDGAEASTDRSGRRADGSDGEDQRQCDDAHVACLVTGHLSLHARNSLERQFSLSRLQFLFYLFRPSGFCFRRKNAPRPPIVLWDEDELFCWGRIQIGFSKCTSNPTAKKASNFTPIVYRYLCINFGFLRQSLFMI